MMKTELETENIILRSRIVDLQESMNMWRETAQEETKKYKESRPRNYTILGVVAIFFSLLISYISMSFFQWDFNVSHWSPDARAVFSLCTFFGGMFLVSSARSVFGRWCKG